MYRHSNMSGRSALDRSRGQSPLYRRVISELERLILEGPIGEETQLPPEWALVERFGVSRGTLRRAIADLEQRGLLWREAGRGTFVNPAARLRRIVWDRLVEVAVPDSRFDLDFSSFIPDYAGSDRCTEGIIGLEEYRASNLIVVMPDNNLESFRAQALADHKRLLVCTYAMARGFVLLEGSRIPASKRALAATLDGMERFGPSLSFSELTSLPSADMLVTGAAAISTEGVHFGKGHGYLDIEWGLLRELGLVDQDTPVVGSVHDCQLVTERVPHAPYDVTVDVIVTPHEVMRCSPLPKPPGIFWDRLPGEFARTRPYFAELEGGEATQVHRTG
jgi:5-formyltetrahydrofolate cyclo-ligase